MCTPQATSISSYWGNALQGIYITWGNTATDCAGTIAADTEMSINVDIRLYGVLRAAESETVTSTETFVSYFLFMNPYDYYDYEQAAGDSS